MFEPLVVDKLKRELVCFVPSILQAGERQDIVVKIRVIILLGVRENSIVDSFAQSPVGQIFAMCVQPRRIRAETIVNQLLVEKWRQIIDMDISTLA